MATLDGFAPYATGMTAREAVDALWSARNLESTGAKLIKSETVPSYSNVKNELTFWYNTSTNKLYKARMNEDDRIVIWFEV